MRTYHSRSLCRFHSPSLPSNSDKISASRNFTSTFIARRERLECFFPTDSSFCAFRLSFERLTVNNVHAPTKRHFNAHVALVSAPRSKLLNTHSPNFPEYFSPSLSLPALFSVTKCATRRSPFLFTLPSFVSSSIRSHCIPLASSSSTSSSTICPSSATPRTTNTSRCAIGKEETRHEQSFRFGWNASFRVQRDVCALDGICRDRPSLRGTRCFVVRRRVGSLIVVVVVVVVVVVRLQRWYILQQRERTGELNRCRIRNARTETDPGTAARASDTDFKREQRGEGEGYRARAARCRP